ncbi:MAG: peptidoglycan-binding protein [Methylocystaceae bacterium]|nr:peptidoglycan-binding protein [Methylocystaceae bacterium]
MTSTEIERELRTMQNSLEAPFLKARAAGDQDEMDRLQGIADEIDLLLDQVVLIGLAELALRVAQIRARIEKKAAEIQDFNTITLAEVKEKLKEILDFSSEDEIAAAEAAPASGPARDVPVIAEPPVADAGGALILTEAHLVALWRRSLFPIDDSRIVVFGLRGCRPVDFGGTDFVAGHEIAMTPVDYLNMNCTIGQWRPGHGIALFPGSTVPFGTVIQQLIPAGGQGVNRMGRGRMKRYRAGWHKRREREAGHWALIQECAITIQRTGNDPLYDDDDPWEAGRIAGDNIHCAFHMGVDGKVADAPFSSAGCQTIAGTVRKGQRSTEAGPWKRFITPFARQLGSQKECEYILLDAEEVRMMIRTHCSGNTVILRFGSEGPLVRQLQVALNAKAGAALAIDGDFGPSTFRALVDFQDANVGIHADDGIVGPMTASLLGIDLPAFDFNGAIGGGAGHAGPTGLGTVPASSVPGATAVAPMMSPGAPLAFGKLTRAKHGQVFNDKVIQIAARLGCDPNHLMAVMAFETGQTFAPDQKNHAGSSAIGLIQFMPNTAAGLGTSSKKLAGMSAIEQLDFVEKHVAMHSRGKPLASVSDVYMTVLLPAAVGMPESHILFQKPSKAYEQNRGLDRDGSGTITKAEAAARVADKLVVGMRQHNLG